jgi:beta-mannosidase
VVSGVGLTDGWTVETPDGRRIPATVPGCVHLDLLAAGLIEDPYLDDNEVRTAWIGRTAWVYRKEFDWAPTDGRSDLVFDGLDTIASVEVNGVEVGRTANMHRSYRFDVTSLLRAGRNEVSVRFEPVYEYAEQQRARLGERPNAYPEPFNFVRKMACNFGWDWGPTLVTAGIWQPVELRSWQVAYLKEVRPVITVDGPHGTAELHVGVELARNAELTVVATIAGQRVEVPVDGADAMAQLHVAEPELWWPRGHGDQPRYDLTVELWDRHGKLDSWHRKVGFRSVRVDTRPDRDGTPFTLVVNDRPIFVRGVNWIPDDVFPTRVTRERYARRLAQACAANVNFVRVWGGGRYESDDFYDLADEYGLLVGQDFLFACAAYPEEEPFASEVAAEAREQVVRLASHPSLVLWTGNNENIWGFHDWDWQRQLDGRSWGLGFYLDLLPRVVADADPTRPYWPGSPYSGRPDLHPNDPAHGTTHIWDVWNSVDYAHYRDYRPRFVAEFGFQAFPTWATLRAAVTDDPLTPDSPGVAHHQKAVGGNAKLRRWLEGHLPAPESFDDWLYLTQVNQARAITLGIEHFRSLRPLCMGTVVWQLNDCWPGISWSAVDGAGRTKPLWYALRRAYADRLLTIQPAGDGLTCVAVNETGEPWVAPLTVRRLRPDGTLVHASTLGLEVDAYGVERVPLAAADLVVADVGDTRAYWFAGDAPKPGFTATAEAVPGGYRVVVTAGTVVRDLALFPDRLDPAASVDDALVTLLPGETATFAVTSTASLDPDQLTRPPVLRCVGDR